MLHLYALILTVFIIAVYTDPSTCEQPTRTVISSTTQFTTKTVILAGSLVTRTDHYVVPGYTEFTSNTQTPITVNCTQFSYEYLPLHASRY